MDIQKKALEFIKEYSFTEKKLEQIEELKAIIIQQEFDIFMFGDTEKKEVTNIIDNLSLESKRTQNAFTYISDDFRAVFLKENLTSKEYCILLMHEEAHIFLNHLNKHKRETTIYDEEEAHDFVRAVKSQLKTKENKISSNPAIPTNNGKHEDNNEHSKHIIKLKNIVLALLLALVLILIKSYNNYNRPIQQLNPLETITTIESIYTNIETSQTITENSSIIDTNPPEIIFTSDDTSITTTTETITTMDTLEDINQNNIVYITKTGKKYHRADCYMISNKDVIALSITEAQKLYEPCAICRPNE